MFGSLKKKLSNAIQEGIVISESLQQQYRQRVSSSASTSAATTPTTPPNVLNDSLSSSRSSSMSFSWQLGDAELNVAAGCNMLAKYEDDWQQIHAANEENATRAASVAMQISAVEQRSRAQRVTITDLNSCLAGIPVLVAKLKESVGTLQALEQMSAQLEEELEKLEDLCEECELHELMLEKQCEKSAYQQKKMSDLESYRQKIAAQHQAKIQEHEQRLRKIQRERQAVFDDAFRGDLEEYKQRGQLTKIQTTALPDSNNLALEEVELEQNDAEAKDALEQFLNG